MIGKPAWFQRRKYGGWGVFPKTWQGWVYVAVMVGLLGLTQVLPMPSEESRLVVMFVLALILALDMVHIMINIPRDERDRLHEAISERNALWAIIAVLVIGIGYQASVSVASKSDKVDPVIIVALIVAVITKAVTNLYLDRND